MEYDVLDPPLVLEGSIEHQTDICVPARSHEHDMSLADYPDIPLNLNVAVSPARPDTCFVAL